MYSSMFTVGMYVRFPLETERTDDEFREFRIGQIRDINETTYTTLLRCVPETENEPSEIECSLNHIERCRILPESSFTTLYTKRVGKVLIHCSDVWLPGQFLDYYVLFDGEQETKRISEAEIKVSSIRQNPDPYQQLRRYEFQNPIWKSLRDQVIESYSILHNATFGFEDLVGSRIMLLAHQAEVVARVLSDVECRYILADEVGLGKTIEASVILRGLLRRYKKLKTLIIAPQSLVQQWHNELNTKFWLDFPIIHTAQDISAELNGKGYIVATEDLHIASELWTSLSTITWGLLIVDEAHHLRKLPTLYDRVRQISAQSERALVLSATPIERRAKEYLKLLALMHPHRYHPTDVETFQSMLSAQSKIRRRVASLARNLNLDDFDTEEFEEEIEVVVHALERDTLLPQLVAHVSSQARSHDHGLQAAREVLAYISENYRIENRVIRNRRTHLDIQLPERTLDVSYSYAPAEEEIEVLDALYEYVDAYIQNIPSGPLIAEYCRILMHSASSSPHALLHLLEMRSHYLTALQEISASANHDSNLTSIASPRQEATRIAQVIATVPSLPDEQSNYIDVLLWRIKRWVEQTDKEMQRLSIQRDQLTEVSSHRLGQVLRALDAAIKTRKNAKIIVFSAWSQTLSALLPHLIHRYGSAMIEQFTAQLDMEKLQEAADAFQVEERCRILLCDELGGEGRNFQMATQIVHVDLPWTPAQIEQRIGRVDRLGREGTVLSIVPFAQDWPEHALFRIWQDAYHLFTQSMSGLEIALEGIQDRLLHAIMQSSRNGIASLVPLMVEGAEELRQTVEEERYFEEVAINRQRRDEFASISTEYNDGKKLGLPILKWAELAGLSYEYDSTTDTLYFTPKHFNINKMKNAKFFNLPDMQEALHRSGRRRDLVIRGTFNRNIAVQRENLVFFAPSSDRWTDAIIANALEADRGRCCAIKRYIADFKGNWHGIELLYSLSIDPRPLYAAGFVPVHLFRALGYFRSPLYRLLISSEGNLEDKSSRVWKETNSKLLNRSLDTHLGKRDTQGGKIAPLQAFKTMYPLEEWNILLENVYETAQRTLDEELEFLEDVAIEARDEFAQRDAGLYAANLWLNRIARGNREQRKSDIKEYEKISAALAEGILHPLRQLESACFWILEGGSEE